MSQQNKKGNLGFIILIVITILIFILGTLFLIKYTNDKKKEVEPEHTYELKDMSLKFDKVSNANTIDVFKEYPLNPIEVTTKDKVQVSGLKNSEVENKVNEVLSELKVQNKNYCYVRANFSNVLSVECGNGTGKTVSLVDGHEITLEEVFNDDTDLKKIILDNIYDNLCNYQFECWLGEGARENEDDFEAQIIKYINEIKRRDYSLVFSGYQIYLNFDFPDDEDEENYWSWEESISIPLYDVLDDVTIMDRFLTDENIYKKDAGTCSFPMCISSTFDNNTEEKSYRNAGHYLNDKVYLSTSLSNASSVDFFGNRISGEKKVDLDKFLPKIEDAVVEKLNLEKQDYYKDVSLSASVLAYKDNLYQIEAFVNSKEMDLENFKVFMAGGYNERVKFLKYKNDFVINLFIDSEGNVTEGNDLLSEYEDAHEKILNYIWERRSVEENIRNFMCLGGEGDFGTCSKSDFRDIVENAAYYIDEEKNIIQLLYYETAEWYPGVTALKVKIPMTIFEEI